jgi:hypothetical protein
VGDLVYAGGPVVDPIANTILAYIDSLGPSRQSGYANPLDPWEDKIAISRLADIVLEVKDLDGTRLVSLIPNIAIAQASIPGSYSVTVGVPPVPLFFNPNDIQPKDVAGVIDVNFVREGGIRIVRAK